MFETFRDTQNGESLIAFPSYNLGVGMYVPFTVVPEDGFQELGSGMELGWQAGSKHLCLLSYLASLHHNFLEIS